METKIGSCLTSVIYTWQVSRSDRCIYHTKWLTHSICVSAKRKMILLPGIEPQSFSLHPVYRTDSHIQLKESSLYTELASLPVSIPTVLSRLLNVRVDILIISEHTLSKNFNFGVCRYSVRHKRRFETVIFENQQTKK